MIEGASIMPTADGGSIVDLAPQQQTFGAPEEFDANLAEFMTDPDAIGQELCEAVDDDRKSREEWDGSLVRGIELLGMKIEDRTYPFKGACGVFDPLLAEAVLRSNAAMMGELLPANGPVRCKITGRVTPEVRAKAARKAAWFNLYLTELAPEFYPDFDQMLFWLPLVGSTIKKPYMDPLLCRPVSPYITPTNFIVSYTTTSMENCPRATHQTEMTKRDMRARQLLGVYRDIDLGLADESNEITPLRAEIDAQQGIQPVMHLGDDRYTLLEIHTDLDLKGYEHRLGETDAPSGLPLPYIVTVEQNTKRVLAVRRNWKETDPRFNRRRHFVHYKFLPGLGFYGYGYAHVLGGSAKAATSLRRQLIDAGTLNNFPGGLRVKGMKFDDNNMGIGPTEFREVDTGGLPIQNAVMTMPYKEPSQVLLLMLQSVDEGGSRLAGTQEIAVGEGRQDAPVGTTVALMEAALKLQTATVKRAHTSFRQELKLFDELFGEHMPEEAHAFPVEGDEMQISRADFGDDIDVIPVSNPNITSSAQRALVGRAVLEGTNAAPDIHDRREAFRNYYAELGLTEEQIRKLLPEPKQAQPMDPLSENMAMLRGMPVTAGPAQDDAAHIAVHQALVQDPTAPTFQTASAHMAEHMANAMRKKIEGVLGIQLPPPGTPLPPEIENQIAVLVAKATEAIRNEAEAKNPTEQQLAMEALKIEAKKVSDAATAAQGKLTMDGYKAQLKFITDERDRQAKMTGERMKAAAQARAAREKPRPAA